MTADPSPSSSTDSLNRPSDIVDGVTQENGGGREEGDVELALFRRIRSLSTMSGRSGEPDQRVPSAGYRRYLQHPLSMFSSEPDEDDDTDIYGDNSYQGSLQASSKSSTANGGDLNNNQDKEEHSNLHRAVSTGVAWRDALVQACATLLGKTMDELKEEFNTVLAASATSAHTFSTQGAAFEPIPRDFADYAIISTLKQQDPLSMENASSWLFNMMDRTGAGFVLRDEFIRYAPFIGHIADFAVANIVFDELVREQVRLAADSDDDKEDGKDRDKGRNKRPKRNGRSPGHDNQPKHCNSDPSPHSGLRQRKRASQSESNGRTSLRDNRQSDRVDGIDSNSSQGSDSSTSDPRSRDLYPPSAALHFDMWRRFFQAVQDKYHCIDDDWVRVKREIGIDSEETLIKSQGALDHSDLFPTLGKLYLSQRYLIFFAAVGRNHYVARLGAVADVTNASIPIMMRDCMRVTLESEAKAAMDGVSAVVKDDVMGSAPEDDKGSKAEPEERHEHTQSQHIGRLMRQFTAGRKPLMFSLLEFRERKRRDNWVNLVREMVAAHKLHVQLGFGSSARAVRNVHKSDGDYGNDDNNNDDDDKSKEKRKTFSLNYSKSPFRGEPSPPLLAVAAHSNIVRYRALRRVTRKRVSPALLVFSRAERNPSLTNWYTDSVRAYESQSGRTWIERALAAIRDNMEINDRMYRVQDDEPFDVGKLGDAIGRLAELCAPLARLMQHFEYLIQWRNPPATILAILVCMTIACNGLVHYVPAGIMFLLALWVVETKYNWLGLGMGGSRTEDAEQRQRNVLEMVAQVHDTLAAAQNVLSRINRELGKMQSLFLWGCPNESDSWIAVGSLCFVSAVLMMVPTSSLFLSMVFFMFFKHFLPPSNPVLRFWQSVPSRIEARKKLDAKQYHDIKRKHTIGPSDRASMARSKSG